MSIHKIRGEKKVGKRHAQVLMIFTTISTTKFSVQNWVSRSQAGKFWQQSLKQVHERSAWKQAIFHDRNINSTEYQT